MQKNNLKTSRANMLYHFTANTGHLSITNRSEVGNDVIKFLSPLVIKGEGFIPRLPEIHISLGGRGEKHQRQQGYSVFQISSRLSISRNEERPWVVGVACWNQTYSPDIWGIAHDLANKDKNIGMGMKHNLPRKTPTTPWMSVILIPSCEMNFIKYIGLLGDLERCLFWTLVESEKQNVANSQCKSLT